MAETFEKDKEYLTSLAKDQKPTVLWIGCSDSRVPVNTITQTKAGEIFVHRNVGNIVATNDWNLSAVLEFSINHLHIPDVVVCGHYGCGGITEVIIGYRSDSAGKPCTMTIGITQAVRTIYERLAGDNTSDKVSMGCLNSCVKNGNF